MSVFREATKYIHGDKLWSWNPANHLKDIEISKISTIEAGQMHFVLSIPRYKMDHRFASYIICTPYAKVDTLNDMHLRIFIYI